jgi:hypothetical protein
MDNSSAWTATLELNRPRRALCRGFLFAAACLAFLASVPSALAQDDWAYVVILRNYRKVPDSITAMPVSFHPYPYTLGEQLNSQTNDFSILSWNALSQTYVWHDYSETLPSDANVSAPNWYAGGTDTPSPIVPWASLQLHTHAGANTNLGPHSQVVSLTGTLMTNNTQLVLRPGFNMFSPPWMKSFSPDALDLHEEGAVPGTGASNSDQILTLNENSGLFELDAFLLDIGGGDAIWTNTVAVPPFLEWWRTTAYYHRPPGNINVWISSPYPYKNQALPRFVDVTLDPVAAQVHLTILVSSNQSLVDIFTQDLWEGMSFEETGIWDLAVRREPVPGTNTFVWTDAGGNGRPLPQTPDARMYMVVSSTEDTDADGLSDGFEILHYGSSSTTADSDGDGLDDGEEWILGTNPLLSDSDGDGISDFDEIANGTDPWNDDVIPPTASLVMPVSGSTVYWVP